MTVVHGRQQTLKSDAPPWCKLPSGGYFRMADEGFRHDRHYHEFNEMYLICQGKAKLEIGERFHYVQAGDMVCIPAGQEHDIVATYGTDSLELFWFYEPGPSEARLGHLYHGLEVDAWHDVPVEPVPGDFPVLDQ